MLFSPFSQSLPTEQFLNRAIARLGVTLADEHDQYSYIYFCEICGGGYQQHPRDPYIADLPILPYSIK